MSFFGRMTRGMWKATQEKIGLPAVKKPRLKREQKPLKKWRWEKWTTEAHTKSEARSNFKKMIAALTECPCARLPVDAYVVRIG